MPIAQTEYKDRLFSCIFGSEEHKEWTLSLYNAVNGTHYDDPEQITITTIRDVLYLGMHNDVSFLISNDMNMYEQQSTFNPNMPLRMLQYAGNIFEKYLTVEKKNKYSKRIVTLPVPKLVVFYNGMEAEPDEVQLNLCDAFPADRRKDSDIQVRVRMVNVNKGKSPELMANCKPLTEYAWIVDSIRTLERLVGLEAAIDRTIDNLPDGFQTKLLLEAHRAEVKNMLLTEYNEAKQMDLFFMEGRQEGRQEAEHRINALYAKLLSLGRNDDLARAINEPEYRERLYAELGMDQISE